MNRIIIALLVACSLGAQTGNPIADNAISAVQSLANQNRAQAAQINLLQSQIAALQPQADFAAQLDAACVTCRAVILNAIGTQTNLVGNMLCCGPTTVPPTPVALPPGYMLIFIGPQPSTIVTTGTPH